MGHNNNQGMFKLSGMKEYIENKHIKLLADRGYTHFLLITPEEDRTTAWLNIQKGKRSVVEVEIGFAKNYALAAAKFRQSPELHEISLMAIYALVNMMLQEYPIQKDN